MIKVSHTNFEKATVQSIKTPGVDRGSLPGCPGRSYLGPAPYHRHLATADPTALPTPLSWGLQLHLCRWGVHFLSGTRAGPGCTPALRMGWHPLPGLTVTGCWVRCSSAPTAAWDSLAVGLQLDSSWVPAVTRGLSTRDGHFSRLSISLTSCPDTVTPEHCWRGLQK